MSAEDQGIRCSECDGSLAVCDECAMRECVSAMM